MRDLQITLERHYEIYITDIFADFDDWDSRSFWFGMQYWNNYEN